MRPRSFFSTLYIHPGHPGEPKLGGGHCGPESPKMDKTIYSLSIHIHIMHVNNGFLGKKTIF